MTDQANYDEDDEVFFEADPELDAAINEDSDDWYGRYSIDDLLEEEGNDKDS
jgi:hypothetical protein